MRERVLRTIQNNQLFLPGQKVVVAVSGGPDSLMLLHVLGELSAKLGITLHVAHIHHGLRAESDQEAVAVKKMAIGLGLPVSVSRVNVENWRQKAGTSLQAAARQVRYGALERIAHRVGAACIATAHHRDDLVETLLLRLLSGSGLDGLKGFPIQRVLPSGLSVVRPLYDVTREEIEAYCRTYKLKPLQDPTNRKVDYLRNRVRLRLLPFLEREFGSHVRQSLARAAALLGQDSTLLTEVTSDAFARVCETAGRNSVVLNINKLHALPPALQDRVVRSALWQSGVKRPGRLHVEQVVALTIKKSPSAQLTLPDEVRAWRQYHRLCIGRPEAESEIESIEVVLPGQTCLKSVGQKIEAEIRPVQEVSLPSSDRNQACLDLDRLKMPLVVRRRKPGDRMHPLGAPGKRKVKKVLADRKVPRRQREEVPLVLSGEEIAWLGGVEIAEPFRITKDTKRVLLLRLDSIREKDDAECQRNT
ncbi:tRNA lysidine(34) synthetase TilS [Dethiobacter alkaliphilus]|uniref:tRNA lysidine(34) synthetase TilS n=1 Tax=Dethiobacter alkaliphilus TaxID=427926 RepID=UPI0022273E6B|nr:tRNA lysidine(34) synthetase TilS [Dethiobacter alkaliphilus]MCW3489144.1 tRNA lysidine(34) synthetase TilS [Dethiobacter alkaliphilus]